MNSKLVRSEVVVHARVRAAEPKATGETESAIAAAEQRGFAQGLLEGKRVAERELAPARENYDRTITEMATAYSRLVASIEESAVELATGIAEKIIRHELETKPDNVERLVSESLEPVRMHANVTVRLSPQDFSRLKNLVQNGTVSVTEDPSLSAGDFVIETAKTHLDGRVTAQVEALGRAMLEG